MSRRRKHVRNQLEELCPELNDGDAVCRVVELRGGNQVQVRDDVDVRSARRRIIASRSSLVRAAPTHHLVPSLPQVEKPDASTTLIRIPSKFSKVLWVRKGSHVLAHFEEDATSDAANGGARGSKVTGELLRVLYAEQIKELRRARPEAWPERFGTGRGGGGGADDDDGDAGVDDAVGGVRAMRFGDAAAEAEAEAEAEASDDDDGLPPLEANTNRRRMPESDSSSEEEEEVEEEEEDDDD